MHNGFRKITPVNGFDVGNLDNARQNDYAWAMADMGDYLYVGTGRNIVYSVLASGTFGDIRIPGVFVPENLDMRAEIWRYKKDGSQGWEKVFKAPAGIIGFRFMIRYTTPEGEEALYAGAYNLDDRVLIAKSTNGSDWEILDTGITVGNNTRAMINYNGKLYMGVLGGSTDIEETYIYESTDPERRGWTLVTNPQGDPNRNPQGAVTVLTSFNGHLYVSTARPGGFEVWRTRENQVKQDDWILVVDKGAGDALNEIPLSMGVFKNHLYVGTAITFAIVSIDTDRRFIPPKPFDIIRIDRYDNWQVVVGSEAIEPTNTVTGERGQAISGLPSGFGNPFNGYCWQIQQYNGEVYVGTWDWSVLIIPLLRSLIESAFGNSTEDFRNYYRRLLDGGIIGEILRLIPIKAILNRFMGFDLYKSSDGIHWETVTINGLGNPYNYGARNLYVSQENRLYLGTANPFEGCEVWVKARSGQDISHESIEELLKLLFRWIRCIIENGQYKQYEEIQQYEQYKTPENWFYNRFRM